MQENGHGDKQQQAQALLDRRLAASGWDAAQCRLDPVWKTSRIFDLDAAAPEPIRMRGGWIQAPTVQQALDALREAKLHCTTCLFDRDETERRLRLAQVPEWQVEAAVAFTCLTNASVFRGYGPQWQKLEEWYLKECEALMHRHQLLLTLARMRGAAPSAFDKEHHSERNPVPFDVVAPTPAFGVPDTKAHQLPNVGATTGGPRDGNH